MEALSELDPNKLVQGLTGTETPEEATTTETPDSEAGGEFAALMRSILSPSQGNQVNEEELFAAIIQERLQTTVGQEAADEFAAMFAAKKGEMARGDGYIPVEDAAKAALAGTVESGLVTAEQAATVESQSFEAAQLDDNKTALYDGRGSDEDPSIAVADMETALVNARAMIEKMENGEEISEETESALAEESSLTGESETITPEGTTFDGAEGFLWKPESDHQKKLVILTPAEMTGQVTDVLLKDLEGNILERGNATGVANGGREHFRFEKAGQDYPGDLTVEVRLEDGSVKTYEIPNPGERYD